MQMPPTCCTIFQKLHSENFQNPMKDFKPRISYILLSTIALGQRGGGADVTTFATIYPAICLHFHFSFLLELSEEFPPVAVRQDHQKE